MVVARDWGDRKRGVIVPYISFFQDEKVREICHRTMCIQLIFNISIQLKMVLIVNLCCFYYNKKKSKTSKWVRRDAM